MKTIGIMMAMLLLMSTVVLAETTDIEAGTTPDSPFYGLDVWWDEMRVKLSMGDAQKAKVRIMIAEERIAEMETMAKEANENGIEIARKEHQKQIQEYKSHQEKIGKDLAKTSLQERFQRHIMNMERVQLQVPEQAKESIAKAILNANQAFERAQEGISAEHKMSSKTMRKNIRKEGITVDSGLREEEQMRIFGR